MLSVSYLTQKLRAQTLKEIPSSSKGQDDKDSGTESDDESADIQELRQYMEVHPGRRSVTSEAADSALPSDSDHNYDHHSSEEELEVINSAEKRKWSHHERSSSEDDELVQFCCSPPAHVHRPASLSPPPKVFHSSLPPLELCSVSPRKRHRRAAASSAVQRPCLDFEKMQQIRVRLL